MSEIKVDKISPSGGANVVTLGDSGDTFTLPSGTTITNSGTATGFGGGKVLQYKSLVDTTLSSTTTNIPTDDTIPQNSEGIEIFGSGLAITPTSSSNSLIIDAVVSAGASSANAICVLALFQDSATDATVVMGNLNAWHGTPNIIHLRWKMAAGTTSATTFHIRIGGDGTTTYCNWNYTSNRDYGGRMFSTFTIMEIDES